MPGNSRVDHHYVLEDSAAEEDVKGIYTGFMNGKLKIVIFQTALKSLMSYLAERELNKSCPADIAQQDRDVEECTENAKVKQEIEKTFQEDFHPAILGKETLYGCLKHGG